MDQFQYSRFFGLWILFAIALVVGAIGLIFVRIERRAHKKRNPKDGWRVYRMRVHRFACQRCDRQYEDGNFIWQDPEGRFICHVSCEAPTMQPTEGMLDVPFDAVRGPLSSDLNVGRAIAVFAPPPAKHNWSSPNSDCGYRDLKPGDRPHCTCPEI